MKINIFKRVIDFVKDWIVKTVKKKKKKPKVKVKEVEPLEVRHILDEEEIEYREIDVGKKIVMRNELIRRLKIRGFEEAETIHNIYWKDDIDLATLNKIDSQIDKDELDVYYNLRIRHGLIKDKKKELGYKVGDITEWISIQGYSSLKTAIEKLKRLLRQYKIKFDDLIAIDVFILIT